MAQELFEEHLARLKRREEKEDKKSKKRSSRCGGVGVWGCVGVCFRGGTKHGGLWGMGEGEDYLVCEQPWAS